MLAIAMVLDGADRGTAAETCGMDRQTLRDWVHRYNAAAEKINCGSSSSCSAALVLCVL
jgi:transposase